MKLKYLLFSGLVSLSFISLKSQAYEQGDHNISLGAGAITPLKALSFTAFKDFDNYKVSGLLSFHGKYGHAISDNLELGVNVNQATSTMSYTFGDPDFGAVEKHTLIFNQLDINARLNVHFGNSSELDPYVGIGLGYGYVGADWTSTNPDFVPLSVSGFLPVGVELTAGARYYFSQHVGVYGEVGYAQSLVQAGIVFQLY